MLFTVKCNEYSGLLPVELLLCIPCLQIFSRTLLCRLNLPSFSPSLGLPITALLFAVFSQSFPWLPPHYSSLSPECLHLWDSVSLPYFFFIAPITTRHIAFFFFICLFPYKCEFFESGNFVTFTSVCLVPRPLPAF